MLVSFHAYCQTAFTQHSRARSNLSAHINSATLSWVLEVPGLISSPPVILFAAARWRLKPCQHMPGEPSATSSWSGGWRRFRCPVLRNTSVARIKRALRAGLQLISLANHSPFFAKVHPNSMCLFAMYRQFSMVNDSFASLLKRRCFSRLAVCPYFAEYRFRPHFT